MYKIAHNDRITSRVLLPAVPRDQWDLVKSNARTKYRRWIRDLSLEWFRLGHPWESFSESFRTSNECFYTEELWRDGWTLTTEQRPADFKAGDRVGYQVLLEIDLTGEWFLVGCDCGNLRLRHWSDWKYIHLAAMTCGHEHRRSEVRRIA